MKASEILSKYKLRRTACRLGIIEQMQCAGYALSEIEIKGLLSKNFDRTTFYRSFKTLVEKGVLHKIVLDNQQVRYALKHFCDDEECVHLSNGEHIHFLCEECNVVQCFDSLESFSVTLPRGYQIKTKEILVKGICANCS